MEFCNYVECGINDQSEIEILGAIKIHRHFDRID